MSDRKETQKEPGLWSRFPSRTLLIRFPLIFFFASLALFLAIESMPEDPVSLRVKNPDPERIAEIRNNLGLNDPLPVRYIRTVGNFVIGDWGESLISGREVRTEVANYLPATLELSGIALIMGITFGLIIALAGNAFNWPGARILSQGLGALGLTVPIFWLGILFILFFSVRLGWLPVGGRYDFMQSPPQGTGFYLLDTLFAGNFDGFFIAIKHLALPAFTLSLYPAALVAGTLDARLSEPKVAALRRALRSRGLGTFRIWFIHILRLLSGPLVTLVGTQTGALIGGAVLTETVFSWPGIGRFLVDGVLNRDLFVIQNGLLLIILLALVIVSLSDILSGILNRSLKEEKAQ